MQPDPIPPEHPVKVLVVDDMEENRTLFAMYLKKMPYDLSFAESGFEALEKCKDEQFDLILMDIQMPDMDGYETTRRIRSLNEKFSEAGIFATTANAYPKDIENSLIAGCNIHLSKPIKRDVLIHTMQSWLQQHSERGG